MPYVQAGQRTTHWWILCRCSTKRKGFDGMKSNLTIRSRKITGLSPNEDGPVILSTRMLSNWYSYAQYLLTGRLCNRAHGRGRRTDLFRQRLYNIIWRNRIAQVCNLRRCGSSVWRTRRSSSTKYRNVPVRMTSTGGAHHQSLMNGRSLCNRSPNQSSWDASPSNYDGESVPGILANPVSNQNHKVLCRAIGQGITRVRGLSSVG